MSKIRSYSQMLRYDDFDNRFEYLKLGGHVGASTFGFDRYINQQFYGSHEWKTARRDVIARDRGCDLGVPGYEVHGAIMVHHMNPINVDDIVHGEEWIFDPEFLITVTPRTHNALHYGNEGNLPRVVTARTPNDTKLW
jgi:hypothetical protein